MTGDADKAAGLELIPARRGKAVPLSAGQAIEIVNTHGNQVLDTWAFNRPDTAEFMSMEHTRSVTSRIFPRLGEAFVSIKRRPMLRYKADTSPGRHDTLLCACNQAIYRELGCTEYHRNCEDNLHEALREAGLSFPSMPAPLNLFMNIPLAADGGIIREPPASRPGDAVLLEAMMDLVVVFSACPQDITLINGPSRTPREAQYRVLDAPA